MWDPHLHTHVIVPNRQGRADGVLVSIDGTSLYHEAKAAGVIYQATLGRELNRSLRFEWAGVDPATGMAEIAGISPESIRAWSRRSSQLRAWAANNLTLVEGEKPWAAQLATAQKATRPYTADVSAGRDALLVCDTTEMCDALNRRIHDANIHAEAPKVTAARGQRIAVGDLIISRRNDATMRIYHEEHDVAAADPVRNGNRWRVAAVDTERNRLAARRLGDWARAVFDSGYVRQHITHRYAITVHTAQGVTADTTHAVVGENTTRAGLYVAMTRGRDSNHAYLHQRVAEASEYSDAGPDGLHMLRRGSISAATPVFRHIIATDSRA